MNILANFFWYRRWRGGHWARVTGFFWGKRWIRVHKSCVERVNGEMVVKRLLLILLFPSFLASAQWAHSEEFVIGQEKVSDTTLVLTPTGSLAVGNVGVCVFSTDNVGTASGDNDDHTDVSDSVGNSWTQRAEMTNAGNANASVTVSLWTTEAAFILDGTDTITFTVVSAVAAKAAMCREFTVGAGNVVSVVGAVATDETDNGQVASLASTTVASAEYLFFRGIGYEGDADTTGLTATASPVFTSCGVTSTDGGGEASNIGVSCEWIIATATTETSDPTLTGDATVDNATVFPNLKEDVAPTTNPRAIIIGGSR